MLRVVGLDGRGDEVGEAHVGDEAAALLHLEEGLLPLFPLGHAHLAAEHAGFDAHIGEGLGEAERAAPGFAVLAGLGGGAEAHVVRLLFGGAALVDRAEGEAAGEASGGGAGVDPGEFESDQGQGQVLGALDEAAFLGVHEDGRDAGLVEGIEERVLFGRPVVGVAGAGGDELGYRPAGDGARRLDQHLEVEAVGKTPQDLAHVIAGKRAQGFELLFNCCTHWNFLPLVNPSEIGSLRGP